MRIVHKVCHSIRAFEALERNLKGKKHDEHATCKQCPAWEKIEHHGRCQRMCYGLAVEMINIVKWGNPWGRKYRNSRRAWPKLKAREPQHRTKEKSDGSRRVEAYLRGCRRA